MSALTVIGGSARSCAEMLVAYGMQGYGVRSFTTDVTIDSTQLGCRRVAMDHSGRAGELEIVRLAPSMRRQALCPLGDLLVTALPPLLCAHRRKLPKYACTQRRTRYAHILTLAAVRILPANPWICATKSNCRGCFHSKRTRRAFWCPCVLMFCVNSTAPKVAMSVVNQNSFAPYRKVRSYF
ncbi:uncharacterized protein PHACADRAFT_246070 [Phanerochaete carnosa HHB-10118-sp]|uniref:Uncharacterized protein n=1 Tax=Phanerochaete carnosa (strain HHB-10118-sp) TaxID=650164 RepID=K5XFP0_PHACS|nr:uncharacterized protein PHACADRAFT_246070 [Phanerochaete carnosa HHB-10118-sp]EKM61897.1 hypothetical protein PHACADRAFT_246070 [Phanerochaete carnosa HHB-10118-sp]